MSDSAKRGEPWGTKMVFPGVRVGYRPLLRRIAMVRFSRDSGTVYVYWRWPFRGEGIR